MQKGSIRSKIFLAILLPLILVEGCMLVLHLRHINQDYLTHHEYVAATAAAPFINQLDKKLATLGSAEDRYGFLDIYVELKGKLEFPAWVDGLRDLTDVAFINAAGKRLAATSDSPDFARIAENCDPQAPVASLETGFVGVSLPLHFYNSNYGQLLFRFSDRSLTEVKQTTFIFSAWSVAATLVLGGFLAWWLSRVLTRPIKALAYDSQKLAEGDLDREIGASCSTDEIAQLTENFRQMRDAIREKLQELAESEERFRDFSAIAADWFWEMGADLRFTYISGRVEDVMGLPPEEIIGKNRQELYAGHSDTDGPHWQQHFRRISAREPFDNFRIRWRRPDGKLRITSLSGRPRFSTDGRFLGYRGVGQDVTERVRIEEAMVHSEKMLSVGGLAAGMAHEINNPLAGMMQALNVISNRLQDDLPANQRAAEQAQTSLAAVNAYLEERSIKKMLANLDESGKRIAEIVANMLSFTRRDNRPGSSRELGELLDKALQLAATDYNLKRKYDFKNIRIVREYAPDLPMIPCNSGGIQQVLLNLLLNGAEAMQEAQVEDPHFILRTSLDRTRNMVRFELEDNGPGIPEEDRKRIFEPFFTTKQVGQGTGLGLAVSYFIITENHGGEMSVENKPTGGTRFVILLPLTAPKTLTAGSAG